MVVEAIDLKVTIWEGDLSEDYLRWASQIGVDGIDIHDPLNVPGVREQGYPDLERLIKLRGKLQANGLSIYRVSLLEPRRFLMGEVGGEEEVDNLCKTIECFGKASIPIARPLLRETPEITTTHMVEHRGGYKMRAFTLEVMRRQHANKPPRSETTPEEHWSRCVEIYRRIVPVAEDSGVKLALHPCDPPIPEATFTSGWHRILEAVPSECNGLLYCVGTRYEAGGTQLVLDEIQYYGRKRKIFEVHLRNVRGTLPTTGGFEEVALDDGDMNMFEILQALQKVGFDGPINPDHFPIITGDTTDQRIAKSYAVGYVRALLAALATS